MAAESNQEKELFNEALELPESERAAYLKGACRGDAELLGRVERLLAAHREAEAVLRSTIQHPLAEREASPSEMPGSLIGRYKLLQKIGEGGCGVVYMAEQEQPVRRCVALKIIKLGMDTRQVIARFEAERQALALMDHPNIARVLDAGATATGRPYFVMELVRGVRITEYCDQKSLPTSDRLKLFIQVCQAIQHAHQKGVIHRDIKPSNILVTVNDGAPVPKVIDFGIAKATAGQQLTDRTLFTAFEQFIGTPAYMSPEQSEITSVDIDTRSDIYSLGVLLYELLTGKTPFDANELLAAGLHEMWRTLREKEPPRPSTRLSTLPGEELSTTAQRRSLDAPRLISQLRGDLDWIVMKCLEKDRARRYESASGLSVDIQRHLTHEPVRARPPSALYRFQKAVRRNRLAYAAAGGVGAALIIGLASTTWMFTREQHARAQAVAAERDQSRLRAAAQQARANEARQKTAAQQLLYDSLLGQARATRLARRVGYRDRVFALLGQAKALDVPGKDLDQLRREATGCLGDITGLTPLTFTNFLAQLDLNFNVPACLDPSGRFAAFGLQDGTIDVRETTAGRRVARLEGTNHFWQIAFNSRGNQLFALCGQLPEGWDWLYKWTGVWLYQWTRDVAGQWRDAGRRPLPGALGLLSHGEEIMALMFDRPSLGLRLLDLETGAFVPGYDLTNAIVPPRQPWWIVPTSDLRLIGLGTRVGSNLTASASLDLYEWKTGKQIRGLPLPMVGSLGVSRDERHIAWLSESGGGLYALPSLQCIGTFKEYFDSKPVFCGDLLAMYVAHENRIRLWTPAPQEDVAALDEPERLLPADSTRDGNCLLAAGLHQARLYRLSTPEKLELPGHAGAVTGLSFSPNGMRLTSVGKDWRVRVWGAAIGRTIWEAALPGPGQCVSYSPDGKWLATGEWDTDRIWIWDAQTGLQLLGLGTGQPGRTYSVQFSPDGSYLATAQQDFPNGGGVVLWRVGCGKTEAGKAALEAELFKAWPGRAARALAFSPDGQRLLFRQLDGGPCLWDFTQSDQPQTFSLELVESVECEGFTPDGRKLLAMGESGEILALDLITQKWSPAFRFAETGTAKAREGVQLMSASPDGSLLALSSASGRGVELWNPQTGKLVYALPESRGAVYWLSWSPDSRHLAISRDDGGIAIWDVAATSQILVGLGLGQPTETKPTNTNAK
jgi:WD40 repeat protein